ncbi:hypothetical protein TrST_g13621 [Triparma strigata]|uniref:TNFR-Cys domain-containing protein n=1 Tax=Triparma strigata TaxID=1606541 RepID=A0A9W7F1L9_9STRA|nr:hypothetical protein TrST_g13621 [Triparma strigata]
MRRAQPSSFVPSTPATFPLANRGRENGRTGGPASSENEVVIEVLDDDSQLQPRPDFFLENVGEMEPTVRLCDLEQCMSELEKVLFHEGPFILVKTSARNTRVSCASVSNYGRGTVETTSSKPKRERLDNADPGRNRFSAFSEEVEDDSDGLAESAVGFKPTVDPLKRAKYSVMPDSAMESNSFCGTWKIAVVFVWALTLIMVGVAGAFAFSSGLATGQLADATSVAIHTNSTDISTAGYLWGLWEEDGDVGGLGELCREVDALEKRFHAANWTEVPGYDGAGTLTTPSEGSDLKKREEGGIDRSTTDSVCSDDTLEVLLSLISRMRGDNRTADAIVVPAITSDLNFFPLRTTTTETCYLKEIEPAANFSVNPSKDPGSTSTLAYILSGHWIKEYLLLDPSLTMFSNPSLRGISVNATGTGFFKRIISMCSRSSETDGSTFRQNHLHSPLVGSSSGPLKAYAYTADDDKRGPPASKSELDCVEIDDDARAGSKWSAPKPSPPRSSASSKLVGNSVGVEFEEIGSETAGGHFNLSLPSLLCLLPVAVDVVLGIGLPLMMVVAVLNCLVAAVAAVGPALSGFGRKRPAGQASGQTGAGRRFLRSPRWPASKPRFFKLAFLFILLVVTPVLAAVHYANDHPVLFNFISNGACSSCTTGNNIIDNDDSVAVGVGTFSGAPYARSATVYYTDAIYFSLVCSGAAHNCVLDGSDSRQIMLISGTGGACKLSSNQASKGGGIFAQSSGTTVNLYTTSFDGNTASNNGDDIYVYNSGCSVIVHSSCPPDWSGTPAAGSDLDTYNSGGTLSGTTKSFDIGTCSLSCPAGQGGSACVSCIAGKFSGEGSSSCSSCPAGKYLTNAATSIESSACTDCSAGQYSGAASSTCLSCAAGQYSGAASSTCSSCAAGKYLTDAATSIESSACSDCSAGQYSGTASSTCSSCAAGKYLTDAATSIESSACSDCSAGQYSGAASSTCSSCAAGKYLTDAATSIESSACSDCSAARK